MYTLVDTPADWYMVRGQYAVRIDDSAAYFVFSAGRAETPSAKIQAVANHVGFEV